MNETDPFLFRRPRLQSASRLSPLWKSRAAKNNACDSIALMRNTSQHLQHPLQRFGDL